MKTKKTEIKILLVISILSTVLITGLHSQPSLQWVSSFNGANDGNDRAVKAVTDAGGNIYLLGTVNNSQTKDDMVLVKYSAGGVKQWEKFYYGDVDDNETPVDIQLDQAGNVYVVVRNYYTANNFSYERSVLKKYSPSGSLLWTYEDKQTAGITRLVKCLTISSDNYVYMAGRAVTVIGNVTYNSPYILKLNLNGGRIDSIYNIYDVDTFSVSNLNDIITDNSGNVYVTGSRGKNIYTVKLNSGLDTVWTKSYNGSGNGIDAAVKIAFDNNFNVYAAGYILSANSGNDYAVIKYSNGGAQVWAKTYNGPANGNDQVNDMAVQPDGSVYITGRISGGSSGYDFGTMRITSAGNIVWTNIYDGSSNGNDAGTSIALDNAGALYVAGTSVEGTGGTDFTIIKYSTLFANQHWVSKYSLSTTDSLSGMLLDNNYNLVVYGHHKRFLNSDRDMSLIKFGSTIGIEPVSNSIPANFELSQNYPNPFNPVTNIQFAVPKAGNVKLVVFDVTGKTVSELVNGEFNPGTYKVDFNAPALSSGVYFYKLAAGEFNQTRKMILTK